MNGIKIVSYICSSEGRMPEVAKVIKILEWPPCNSVMEARAFIGICVYYRIWIECFAMIAAPIYALFRKNTIFRWMYACQDAIDTLKTTLTTAPALVCIVYGDDASLIILAADASLDGWSGVLM